MKIYLPFIFTLSLIGVQVSSENEHGPEHQQPRQIGGSLFSHDTSTTSDEQSTVAVVGNGRSSTNNDRLLLLESADQFQDICQPRHLHLSVGSNQGADHTITSASMIVSFSFLPECIQQYGEVAVGAVRVGKESNKMYHLFVGDVEEVQNYNASLTKHQIHQLWKRGITGETLYYSDDYYHIDVNGLEHGTRYYYECLLVRTSPLPRQSIRAGAGLSQTDDQRNNYLIISRSEQSTFLTPPSPGQWYPPPLDRTIKFAVLGDLANRPHSRETVASLEQSQIENASPLTTEQRFHRHHSQGIDCILFAGDLSYANGDHSLWDDWMDMMSENSFFRKIPIQIALGNHDVDHLNTLEIGLAYEKRFRMPQVQPAIRNIAPNDLFTKGSEFFQPKDFLPYEYGNAYYSYTFGPSKHIVLSSYSNFRPGSTQYKWLVSELESVDRSVTPWLVVMLHCPLYTTFKSHHKEIFITEARKYLEPVFVEHTVNFVISGHIHSYMRSVPTINDKPDARGPIYIIQGNGGRQVNVPYLNTTTSEEWVKVRDHAMFGYGTLELFNETHAAWKWVKTGFNAEGEGSERGNFQPDFGVSDEVWVMNQLFVADE